MMLIFGHPWIKSPTFKKVFSKEDIAEVSSGEMILLEPLSDSIVLAQHCQAQRIDFAVTVTNVTEALFVNALGGKYLVCQLEDATKIQPIAQEYLFDTKVLTLIISEREIQKMAELSIDGVIFPEAITVS
jgi:hypothetical protein